MCAEKVSPLVHLRGDPCPHCESVIGRSTFASDLHNNTKDLRLLGYLLVGTGSVVGGLFPFIQFVVLVVGMVILHVLVLRRQFRWLSPVRRICAKITLKILASSLASVAFLFNALLAALVGANSCMLGAIGFLFPIVYIELGLWMVKRRLEWEAGEEPLKPMEWILPALLLGGLLCSALVIGFVIMGFSYLLFDAEIPSIQDLFHTLKED